GREVYFMVTGQNTVDANADYSRSKYGRAYRLNLDATDPLKGTLELVLDGDDRNGPAKQFQNVDNVCATENYLYVQEDPNSYGDETHDSYIYQLNLRTNEFKPVIAVDPRRTAADAAKYNVGGPSRFGAWEFGALVDVSDVIGVPNTFTLAIQPHTWIDLKYLGVDGGKRRGTASTVDLSNQQASQIVVIKGLPR
ncbi:MAG: hypothetical protein H7Z72_09785, partial [Bacteroidetes bacterium]|nr:hypothetical protein [Fibrella sp.]